MKYRRHLLATVAVATVVLGLVYIARPAGHTPPYDANLVRLAESELQGYCAGDTLYKTAGEGNAGMARECRARLAAKHSDEPYMPAVIGAFCQAIVDAGWEGTKADCTNIMVENQYWPTYAGGLSNQWNRARPYPRAAIVPADTKKDGSRTGEHENQERPTDYPRGIG